ncbi:hypothetical protein Ana3638_03370 [Anaerocolumna sedimenticola]|uniref:ABC transporter substrate-binding protein n=1 Tax=Anaerocolumna sedimenticola TaxID=2696063 RepID=A0A6P1TIJ9_9FIRM|nr:hypothetical protein [Anaerocolumna sedimenticola]QHQ59939.1 hypothetical protein Ana3638_03370 [Anaerocolumna sedimenticola]
MKKVFKKLTTLLLICTLTIFMTAGCKSNETGPTEETAANGAADATAEETAAGETTTGDNAAGELLELIPIIHPALKIT